MTRTKREVHVPASSVRVLSEMGLGSPTPTLFLASTRNSYSTQALRSTTVAVSVFPSITSGTGKTHQTRGAQKTQKLLEDVEDKNSFTNTNLKSIIEKTILKASIQIQAFQY